MSDDAKRFGEWIKGAIPENLNDIMEKHMKMTKGSFCIQVAIDEKGIHPFKGDLYPEDAKDFNQFLYRDAKFRALKELMNLTPDQVLLLGRRK